MRFKGTPREFHAVQHELKSSIGFWLLRSRRSRRRVRFGRFIFLVVLFCALANAWVAPGVSVGPEIVQPIVTFKPSDRADQEVAWVTVDEVAAVVLFAPHLERGFDLRRERALGFVVLNPTILYEGDDWVSLRRDLLDQAPSALGLDEVAALEKFAVGCETAIGDAREFCVKFLSKVVVSTWAIEPALLEVDGYKA
jgi:hypothetical protein